MMDILGKLLILCLIGLKTTIAIKCTIDTQNNLNVPSGGCTLPFTEDRQINIETLTLNGPLMIDSHNHLKYKNIVCVEDKSEILIKSNYEKIVVEDINPNSCLNPCKLNIQFDSKSQNVKYSIEQINNMQELVLIENPITLFKGVKILISSISGNVEFAEVSKVKDKIILLKNKLQYNHQTYIYQDTEENAFQYPEIIVLDENRAVFKNNCFIVKPKKSLELEYSSGGIFIDMKEFEYEGKLEIKQSIFIQNEGAKSSCIKKIKCQISYSVFIGISNAEIYVQFHLISLSFINIKNSLIINNNKIHYSQFINFDGILKSEDNDAFYVQGTFFQNSQITFEVQQAFIFDKSKFISCDFKQTELSKIVDVDFTNSYFQGKPLDLSFISANSLIQRCIFDGKGLKNAILVKGQKLLKKIYIQVNLSVFNEFVDLDTSLITTSSKNPKFLQDENIIYPTDFIYTIDLNRNSYNLKLNDAQKIIDIPQSAIVLNGLTFFPFKIEKFLPQNLFKIENSIFNKQKLIQFTQSSFSIDLDNQDKQDGQYFKLISPQSTEKYDLGKSYYFFDKQKRYYGQLFDKNNKSFTPSKLLMSVKVYQKESINIYLDPEQPVLEITLKKSELNEYDMKAKIDLDGSLYIEFDKNSQFLFEIQLKRCQKGQYLSKSDSENLCVNQCKNEETIINNICSEGEKIETYYIKDKKYLPCINKFCSTCTNSSDCTSCINGLSHLSDQFCIEPNFQKIFVQENQKMVEKSCPPNCWQCKDQNTCEICSLDYVLSQEGKCVDTCQKEQFKVIEKLQCDICFNIGKCTECYSNPKIGCKSCQPGYLLQKQGSCIKCLQNQYFEDGVCKSCHPSCLSCSGGTQKNCNYCNDGFSEQDGQCTKIVCSENQFIFNNECQDCYNKTNTKGCFGPYPHSHTCEKGYYAQVFQDSCKKCNTECQECEFEPDNCIACAEKYILTEGKCIVEKDKCKMQVQNCVDCDSGGSQCTLCTIGYYLSQGKCMKCDESCEECSSSSICIKCPNSLFLEEQKCVSSCSNGYRINERKCEKQSSDSSQSDGVVVGIVVGCFVGVILVIVTILGIKRMRIQQKIKKQDQYVVTTNNQLFSCQDVDTKNNLDDEKQIIK